jgi:hypothetical protein
VTATVESWVEMGRSATVLGWSSGVLPTEQWVQSTGSNVV